MNLDLHGFDSGYGFFFSNDVDDVNVCSVNIDSFRLGFYIAGSNSLDPDNSDPEIDGKNTNISLSNSRITNNSVQGFLGGCSDCSIMTNFFDNNGYDDAVYNHNIYLSGGTQGVVENMKVVGNELYRSAIVDGECQGVSFVVHGEYSNLLIEDNYIHEDLDAAGGGCWGIAIDSAYSRPEAFRNLIIRRNKVVNVGNTSIGLNACQDCFIENNVIINEQDSFSQIAIAVPDRTRAINDLAMERVTIRNNSIYLGANTRGNGISLQGEGFGHRSVNNVVY